MSTARCIFLILVLWVSVSQAHALDIIWEPLSNSSHPDNPAATFDEEPPLFDSVSAGLLNILNEVEREFEAAFNDAATIRITYWWDDDMGFCCGQSIPSWIEENPTGTLTHSVIRFDSTVNYFIDSTPENDSEYDMAQVQYNYGPNALFPPTQAARFTGNVPDLFEAGYNGTENSDLSRDLLTLAFQEVGHSLGMNAGFSGVTNGGGTGEVDDNDYDVNTNWVSGNVMDMLPRGSTPDPLDHLAGNDAVMGNLSISSERTRPSAADFFAIALTQDWTNVDLPRKDFLGGADWETGFNWMGGREPDSLDAAFVRHGGNVTIGGGNNIGNVTSLLIDNASSVDTQSHLLVADNIVIQKTTGGGTPRLIVNNFGDLISETVSVNDGTRLEVLGGNAEVENSLNILAGGALRGHGTVDISSIIGTLTSTGLIRATGGGELVITSDNNIALDLGGTIEAIDDDLRFETGMLTSMAADMTVGTGRQVAFNAGGSIGVGGSLQLEGTANGPATSTGSILFVEAGGLINASGLGVVENTLILQSSGSVTTEFGDPNSEIQLNGTTLFQGGNILGHGIARQNGEAFVMADTTISINTYDMDGVAGNTTTTIDPDTTLDINSPNIDITTNDFDGALRINSGTLDVEFSWLLDGTINLNKTDTFVPTLTGDGILTIRSGGQLNVSGTGNIDQQVIIEGGVFAGSEANFNQTTLFTSTAMVETDGPGDAIDLNGITTMAGGSYVGNGAIKFDNQVFVTQDTSIGMADTDLDGDSGNAEINIQPNITFSVSSINLELTANDGFDGVMNNQGTFSSLVGFRLDGQLNMSEFGGATTPALSGLGNFTIFTTGEMNTDGDAMINRNTSVQGGMNIGQGVTQINGTTAFESTAAITIATGGELELNGTTTFLGGSYTGAGLMQWNADTMVDANTTVSTERIDLDGASENTHTTIANTALVLNVDRIDETNNLFAGTIDVNGNPALLEVNLSNPILAWRLSSAGTLNFVSTTRSPLTMLDGSDLSAEGSITTDGVLRLGVNVGLKGSLSTANTSTDVHFGGGGRSFIYNTATVSGPGQMTIDNGSTMNLENSANVGLDVSNDGRLEIGFLANEVNIDVVEPGAATIRSNFSQTTEGEFAVDLGGFTQGSEFDWLNVIGPARLNGTIEVQLIDNFQPSVGDTFQVLTATSVLGVFEQVVTIDESDMFAYEVTPIYSATSVVLHIDDVFLSADFNHDADVDGADFLTWQTGFGLTMQDDNTGGDANGDGVVGGEDLSIWGAQLGSTFSAIAAARTVPEPTSAWLWVFAATQLVCLRRRMAAPMLAPGYHRTTGR
ncbi:MAG: hypothetical protein ABGX16_03495 [Pirellulales bacterium]